MGKTTHGIYFWLNNQKIHPSIRGHKKLQAYIEKTEHELIEALGGLDSITPQKMMLLKATIECYGIIILARIYLRDYEFFRPDLAQKGIAEMQPVIGRQLVNYMHLLRQNLEKLGLERVAQNVINLETYVDKTYSDKTEGQVGQKEKT